MPGKGFEALARHSAVKPRCTGPTSLRRRAARGLQALCSRFVCGAKGSFFKVLSQ